MNKKWTQWDKDAYYIILIILIYMYFSLALGPRELVTNKYQVRFPV